MSYAPYESLLDRFKTAFMERYEDAEVPLMTVLDAEIGIGYKQDERGSDVTPLVDDIVFGGGAVSRRQQLELSNAEITLFRKYLKAVEENKYEIDITDKDLEKFEAPAHDLPLTMASMITIVEEQDAENNIKEKIQISSASGSSGANLLGRFCHADDAILKLTRSITQKEEVINPDVIFAEIIHLPEARIGNILLRPVLRDYEIPYLAKAAVDKDHQISPQDLMLSVKNGRLFLRSKSLNKEVIPRLSSAHNYSNNSLPIYHFLCDFQTQELRRGIYFSWGAWSNFCTFLPRVTYKNMIFSLASWNLIKTDFEEILNLKDDNFQEKVAAWRTKHKMPRYVALADGDNELTIDLENVLCVKTLADTIRKRDSINLVEVIKPHNPFIKEGSESYANQFILTFYRKEPVTVPVKAIKEVEETLPQRSFIAGDQWLYYKIYTGTKTADTILTQAIKPLVENLIAANVIDKWFFIRYADPKEHIRIRFHSTQPRFSDEIVASLHQALKPYIDQELVWKVQLDTYQREIERYGATTIELAESLFHHDSESIVNMIDLIEGDEGEKIRWQFAIRAVDHLLEDFKLSPEEKLKLVERGKDNFGREFGINRFLKEQIDKKFRTERVNVETVLDRSKDEESEMLPLFEILNDKSNKVAGITANIKSLQTQEVLEDLLGSYIHMMVNRLFKSKQRMHEFIIYDFVYRHYRSSMARNKAAVEK